ncbi:transferrin-binding protein-like solute binding protein [Zavarzinia sp.]|uniref:transferrin-binding protein-like solute binding protein n=1 Tax=Zavarzinia sp. TaxID=2027920 RepID=UPI00356694D1
MRGLNKTLVAGAACALLAACGGGSKSSTTSNSTTPPAPITSILETLPRDGSLTTGTGRQFSNSAINGTVHVPASGCLLLICTTPAHDEFPFDFQIASMAKANPGAAAGSAGADDLKLVVTGGTNSTGGTKTLSALFTDWATANSLLTGVKTSTDNGAVLSGFDATDYTPIAGGHIQAVVIDASATVPNLTYMGFAYWTATDVDPTDPTKNQFIVSGGSAFARSGYGTSPDLATIAGLPASATYLGKTVGTQVFPASNSVALIAGDFSLTANFGTGAVSAQITNLKRMDGSTPAGTPLPNITFTGASLSAPTATISGSGGTGMTTQYGTTTPDGPTALLGAFYGPKAEEAGGTWFVSGSNLVPGSTSNTQLSGAFGAVR